MDRQAEQRIHTHAHGRQRLQAKLFHALVDQQPLPVRSLYTGDAGDQEATGLTARGPFTLFGRQHQLALGGESLRTKTRGTAGRFNLNPLTNVDIRTWNPYTSYIDRDVTATNTLTPTYTRQQGLLGTARLSITDPLAVIIGARASWWEPAARCKASPSVAAWRCRTTRTCVPAP